MAQSEYATVWGANRLRELTVRSELDKNFGVHSAGQERQWANLVRKFCSPTAPITGVGEARWEDIANTLQRCWTKPAEAATALRITHNWAEALTKRQARLRAEKHKDSWDKWKKKQAAAGAQGGALFWFVKRAEEDPEVVARCSSGLSATPQAILDQDFAGTACGRSWVGTPVRLGDTTSTRWIRLANSRP